MQSSVLLQESFYFEFYVFNNFRSAKTVKPWLKSQKQNKTKENFLVVHYKFIILKTEVSCCDKCYDKSFATH